MGGASTLTHQSGGELRGLIAKERHPVLHCGGIASKPMFHGQKRYYQVLLDPARAELLDALAEDRGMRPSALLRKVAYEALEQAFPPSLYALATTQDEASRLTSIRNQVEGRRKPKPKVR